MAHALPTTEVVVGSYGRLLTGALVLALGFMAVVLGGIIWADEAALAAGLLAGGLAGLGGGWWLLRRGSHLMRLSRPPHALHLEPFGRTLRQGVPARTVPLADVTGYTQQLSSQGLHLTLYLAGRQTLRLAERPAGRLTPGNVPLADVLPDLTAHLPATAVARPSFYQTGWGTLLAVLAGLSAAAGLALLLAGEGSGWRLLLFSSLYLGLYFRNRRLGRPA